MLQIYVKRSRKQTAHHDRRVVLRAIVCLCLVVLAGCATQQQLGKGTVQHGMALGWVGRDVFFRADHDAFAHAFDTTQADQGMAQLVSAVAQDVDIIVFFGSWCGDSKREVPRFLRLADAAGIPPDRVRWYGLDRTKTSPDGLAAQFRIERVPTFIFLKNGAEVGRIVEHPSGTLAGDMIAILNRHGNP